MSEQIPMGGGDDLDVAAGRCCPTCRHDLAPHNVAVWNAGYSVAMRHAKDDIRDAWDSGFTACANEHMRQRQDPSHPITRANPHDPFYKNRIAPPREGSDFDWAAKVNRESVETVRQKLARVEELADGYGHAGQVDVANAITEALLSRRPERGA